MFNFLKKKLKDTVSKFSRDVEKEVKVEEVEEQIAEPVKKEPKKEVKKKPAPKKPEPKKQAEHKKPLAEKKERAELPKKKPLEKAFKEVKKKEKELKKEEKELEETFEDVEEEIQKAEELLDEQEIQGVKITYFVHGTTTDNEQHLATGWAPGELSKLGREQAQELGKIVSDRKFDIVFCSDLKRALDSAELGFKDNYEIIKDERLRECDYGDYTQKPAKKFKDRMSDFVMQPFPNGESYKHVEKRMAEFLNDLFKNFYGKHIAIVAHEAPQLALDVLLRGRTWNQTINENWRKKKAWRPGWDYVMEEEVEVPEISAAEGAVKEEPVKEEPKKEKRGFRGLFRREKKEEPREVIEKEKEIEEAEREAEEVEEKIEEVAGKKERLAEKAPEDKRGFFDKLRKQVTTFNLSEERFNELFWELEIILMENNVAVEVIEKIKEDLKNELTSQKQSRKSVEQTIADTLRNSIDEVLSVEGFDLLKKVNEKKPYVICMIGVNGSGKTTTLAKLAHLLQKNGKTVVVAAADTFRAAAIQQLEEHCNKLGVKMISQDYQADPAAVAFDAIAHAKARNIDIVLIDTAGRLHSNDNLMNELKKLIRVNSPDLKIFVGESITGNDCVEQARQFNEAVGIDAIILAKADVDEKGGAAISVSFITKKPILYLGTGQTYDDLRVFNKEDILKTLEL